MTDHYPNTAGYTSPDTSKDAADAIEKSGKAQTLRNEVHRVLRIDLEMSKRVRFHSDSPFSYACGFTRAAGMTADEIAAELGESPFSIRPRITELRKRGLIEPTGERRKSSNGRMSKVWRLT